MLILCRRGLTEEDFARLESHLEPLPYKTRWARRGDRLVLHVVGAHREAADVSELVADAAVEHALLDPSPGEIARIFSRRDLLDLALGATGVLAAAALAAPLGLYLTAPSAERSPRGEAYAGRAASIPVGGAVVRVVGDREFLLIRPTEDRFHALAATCTHSRVCVVEWDPKRRQLVCPCHRGLFDLRGNVVSGPPPAPLEHRDVVVRDGGLYVRRSEA